jgi:tetraacyldisaccharide-1-P 4'-kinase
VLLARESGARVFVTRRRDRAWKTLADRGGFDLLLSDDGLMDTRLAGAARIVLARPGERPGRSDLLPAGPYRLTAAVLDGLGTRDRIWYGPLDANEAAEKGAGGAGVGGFRREPVLPDGLDLRKKYWGLCGLGDPASFRRALERAGVRVAGISAGPDHGLPDLDAARRAARKTGAAGFLYSAKDAVKLEGRLAPGESAGRVDERVTFVPDPPLLPGPILSSPRTPPSS